MRAWTTMLLAMLLATVTGCTDREASEARLLVDRAGAIDPYDDVDDRRARVTELEELGLETAEAKRVRDVCVTAHRKLLEAEDASASAREALARAERGEVELSAEQAVEVGRSIERSNEALLEAGEQLPQCQARVADLASKHRIRR